MYTHAYTYLCVGESTSQLKAKKTTYHVVMQLEHPIGDIWLLENFHWTLDGFADHAAFLSCSAPWTPQTLGCAAGCFSLQLTY